jgi:hypothetical protein
MPDVLDPLRHLGDTPPVLPEPLDALRARSARRRTRQRAVLAPLLAVALLGVGLLTASALRDDEDRQRDTVVVDDPTTTSQAPATTATTTPPLLDRSTLVLAGRDGVAIQPPGDAPPIPVTNAPARRAFGFTDGTVVALHWDEDRGPTSVVAYRDGSRRELAPEQPAGTGYTLLHDLVVDGGRPTAIVSHVDAGNAPGGEQPPQWDIHLQLIDVETGERTDLGVVAGWEEGVSSPQLLEGGDVLYSVYGFEGHTVFRRSRDGTTIWETPYLSRLDDTGYEDPVLVLVEGDEVVVAYAGSGPDGPQVDLRRFALADGRELSTATVAVEPADLVSQGYCADADPTPVGILCAAGTEAGLAAGGAVLLDLSDGRVTPVAGVPSGAAATLVRSSSGGRVGPPPSG